MWLLIDLGNSRLKWVCSPAPGWCPGTAAHAGRDVTDVLRDVWGGLEAPRGALAVSVAAQETRAALERWVGERWGIAVHSVRARREQCGVVNRYRDPAALGADRWAALIGARRELPDRGVCVVDCGTAVTIDALSAAGVFGGGVIFPGLALLRRTLTAGTAGIREADGDESSPLARSTADAVAAGALYGLAGAVERVCREFEYAQGEPMELLLTGGDAERVAARLTRPARRVPDLVLRGLAGIAETL